MGGGEARSRIKLPLNPMVLGRFCYKRGLTQVSRAGSGSVDIDFFRRGDLRTQFFLAAAKDPISRIFNFCVNPYLKSIFVRLGEAENFKKFTFFAKNWVSGWKRAFPPFLVNFLSIFVHFLHQM